MGVTLDLLQSPIILITVLVLGTLCETLRRLVPTKAGDKGWRGVFFVLSTGTTPDSQGILPVLLSIPMGFIPALPAADVLEKDGCELAARIGTYLFAGVVCKLSYDLVVGTVMGMIRQRTASVAGRAPTPVPAADPGTPTEK